MKREVLVNIQDAGLAKLWCIEAIVLEPILDNIQPTTACLSSIFMKI
jgi:hypothetical protein